MDELFINDSNVRGSGTSALSVEESSLLLFPPIEPGGFIPNGSFENDFNSWRTIGDTSIETADLGIFPTDGTSQALITTGASDSGGSVVDSDLSEFFDLPGGSLDGIAAGDATEGSAIKQTFTAAAGDVISFDWNFLTNEFAPDEFFNDTGFLSLNGFTFELADTNADFTDAPIESGFSSQTGTQSLTFSVTNAGTYTIGFGAVDVGDSVVDSALAIDNINIQSDSFDPIVFDSLGASESSVSSDVDLVFGGNGFEPVDSSPVSSSTPDLVFGENGFEVV